MKCEVREWLWRGVRWVISSGPFPFIDVQKLWGGGILISEFYKVLICLKVVSRWVVVAPFDFIVNQSPNSWT